MSKYPEIEAVQAGESDGCIVCGDCLEVMGGMADGSVPVIVTDPPYGTRTNQRDGWMVGEFANVLPLVLPEMYRLGTDAAALYMFTSWKWMADWIIRCSPYFRMQNFLIWDKGRHSGCYGKFSWQFCWEGVFYGIKGPRPIREYQQDVLRSESRPARAMEKPVDILAPMVLASSDVGDVVLDPFCGTGSTCVAAKQLGRRYIGIEIDEGYCEIARKRLSETQPLFDKLKQKIEQTKLLKG